MEPEHKHRSKNGKSPWRFVYTFTAVIIIAIIGYYLITEHRAHVAGFLASFPWWILIFLLCPLMHLFHGKHGAHHEDDTTSDKKD